MGNRTHIIKIKKSQDFTSLFFVIVILLTFALFFVVLNKVWKEVQNPLDEGLQSAMPSNPSVNITQTLNATGSGTLLFDKLIPFILIGLFAFVLITAGTYMNHPIMMIVGIIIFGVAIILAVIYSNLYNSITSTTEFIDVKADMGIQDKFMEYLPMIVFLMIIAIGLGVGLWTRKQGGGGL